MKRIDRRSFLGRAAALGAATATQTLAASQAPSSAPQTAGDFVVGFVGLGRRGLKLLETVCQIPGVRISSCCDVVGERLEQARRFAPGAFSTPHFGKVVLNSDVVVIAVPDHLHRNALEPALSYGRDVYLETPVTRTLEESAELAEALKKSQGINQAGTQQVSNPINPKVRELIQAGEIGQVRSIRGHISTNDPARAGYVPYDEKSGMERVYWDFFLGDAPVRPKEARRLFQWRLYWDYSTGLAGSEMAPMIAAIHTLTGAEAPEKVTARGRILHWKEPRETPDHISAILEYPQGFMANLSVSTSGLYPHPFLAIVGDKGAIDYEPNSCRLQRNGKEPVEFHAEGDPTALHVQAFIRAVRERSAPVADLSFGLGVANVAHLVNLSGKLGKTVGKDDRA